MGLLFWKKKEPKPKYPAGLIDEAKKQPNGWVYEIDPQYDPNGEVPPEGIKGGWKANEHGVLTGEYKANPNYKSKNI